MALLDLEFELGRSIDRQPFANRLEGESWMNLWCADCVHELSCSLQEVAMLGRTPVAWQLRDLGALDRYTCTEFVRGES